MRIALTGKIIGSTPTSDVRITKVLDSLSRIMRRKGYEVYMDRESFHAFTFDDYGSLPEIKVHDDLEAIANKVEIAVVMGGDGTMLHAAKIFAKHDVPLIGINEGHVGFITDVPSDVAVEVVSEMIDKFSNIRDNIVPRSMLKLVNSTEGWKDIDDVALNDIVITRTSGRIVKFKVSVDGHFAFECRGDGVIIATPTGSTAYALSAGGSIIHPSSSVFEIAPMMPQSLSCRPLIVNDTSKITVEILHGDAAVFIDGQEFIDFARGEWHVEKASYGVKFIHPKGHCHYSTLRDKLHWQEQPGR